MGRPLVLFLLAAGLAVAAGGEQQWRTAQPGWVYQFPRDHFNHPEFRTEWWYYTGNLNTGDGRKFGFELVFFRQGRGPVETGNPSAWRVDDLYLAHLALTDITGKRFYVHRRINRKGPGLAGADSGTGKVWNGNWSAQWSGASQQLRAVTDEFRLEFNLSSQKPPVIHGQDGISRKADGPGKASHYVSLTRLAVNGALDLAGIHHTVSGSAWMDHEWFTHQLESDQQGWDWFSIQLDDGRELMLFQLRRKDGTIDRFSAGTIVRAGGESRHLGHGEFTLQPLRTWKSPTTGAVYPVEWKIRVPRENIDLVAKAAFDEQELPANAESPGYWEGAAAFTGNATGRGYLEMTGYDKPIRLN